MAFTIQNEICLIIFSTHSCLIQIHLFVQFDVVDVIVVVVGVVVVINRSFYGCKVLRKNKK